MEFFAKQDNPQLLTRNSSQNLNELRYVNLYKIFKFSNIFKYKCLWELHFE